MLGLLGGLVGKGIDFLSGKSAAKKEAGNQREFAQKGIQWKVADANKAGVHPLFALGANTMSYQPSSVGGTDLGDTMASMGANIDRSRAAASDAPARGIVAKLALERAGLENDLLRAQIASEQRRSLPPHVGPAMPQVNSPLGSWDVSPFTPAQDAENQYGEIGGEMVGGSNLMFDWDKATAKWMDMKLGTKSWRNFLPSNMYRKGPTRWLKGDFERR